MANIFYKSGNDGCEYGIWPGTSVRKDGKVIKVGQIYLGRVIDKEENIFFSKEQGYFRFDPSDQSIHGLEDGDIALTDKGTGSVVEINGFSTLRIGGSFFLGKLLPGIEYDTVLDCIHPHNHDRIMALLNYYLLTDLADMHAGKWYENSFTKYLYPSANLYSQRISEFYAEMGANDANRVAFLEKHIEYVKESTDDECCIIIDSTGCQNACKVPLTRISKHENEVNIEFRVIAVVQKSTGLPLYYLPIKGNVIDSSTLDHVKSTLIALGLKPKTVWGDAGYSCPGNLERLILAGEDFVMRLNPTYNLYKDAVDSDLSRLSDSNDPAVKHVLYRNRHINVLKLPTTIGKDPETKESKSGFIFLCKDVEAHMSKAAHLYSHNKDKKKPLTEEELQAAVPKLGVFAIVVANELTEEEVLPAYYLRQEVEQFFDYAKTYAKLMPVRNHTEETIRGHVLMSFISAFICVLIKNRMNLMDSPYCAVPSYLRKKLPTDEDALVVKTKDNEEMILVQDPLKEIFESSPGSMFNELELINAIHFPEKKDIKRVEQMIPDPSHKEANDFFQAFGIDFPLRIEIGKEGKLIYCYKQKPKESCSRALAFAHRPTSEEKAIEKELKKKKAQEEMEAKARAEEEKKAKLAEEQKSRYRIKEQRWAS